MALLGQPRARNPDEFPAVQLFLLAIVRLAEPVALTSIFPYAWALVKDFKIGDESHASFYSGLLISAFSLAEAAMGMYWGGLSDRIGRKPVLMLGCVGTMLSMIMVGIAPNFWVALFGRALGGMLNGNIGVIQTMVGEIVTRPEHEHLRVQTSKPTETCTSSEETPLIASSEPRNSLSTADFQPGAHPAYGAMEAAGVDWDTFLTEKDTPAPVQKIWNKRVVGFIVSLCIFTYHSMTYDHLLPIFFEDERVAAFQTMNTHAMFPFYSPGGLGLSLRNVGMIMAVDGGIALIVQGIIFPWAANKLGTYRLFLLVAVMHPIAYIIMPMLLLVPQSLLYPAIYICLTIRNLVSITLYPLLMILIKDATPCPSALGKVNGLAASAAAACRMISPPVAGFLYSLGTKANCSALAWYGSALMAIIGAVQCFWVPRAHNDEPSEEDEIVHHKRVTAVAVSEVSFYDSD
ncbi:hypothetical protein QQZ08_011241 [Neonectria magnoliae]|uniref:Major facilitator superfamily (MFS) profile domain-containing protein n=1 Tax=Neonectria magnoliae TaxID=2732573 RepID=A0ABR1HCB2_9HYPO